MAVGAKGPLDSKQTTTIEADNKAYLKAVSDMEKADKRAADKRDAAIVKSLKEQDKLTEAAFRTARAQSESAILAGKGVDLVKGKIAEFGKGLIGGAIAGFGAGLLGGGIGSIVQKLFEPPSPEAIQAMANAGAELEVFGIKVAKAAQALQASQREQALATSANKEYAKVLEGLTHKGDLEVLERALMKAQAAFLLSGSAAGEAADAVVVFQEKIAALKGTTGTLDDLSKVWDKLVDGVKELGRQQDQKAAAAAKKWADENKALGKSIDALRGSLDPLLAEQMKLDEAWALLSKGVDRTLISESARTEIFQRQAEALYQVRFAAEEAEKARREEIADLTGAGLATRAGGRIDVSGALGASAADLAADQAGADAARKRAADMQKQRQQLEDMFGSSSPFRGVDAVRLGFDALSESAAAAFDALVSGSESAGKAFAKALGGMLKSDAIHAGVQALKEGAWALGSLAIGDVKGAATHGASAAQWALTAAAAGAGAALLGAGGSGGGSAAGAGGAAPTGSFNGGGGGSGGGIVIVVGDAFASSNPRDRQRYAQQIVRAGLSGNGAPGVRNG